MTGRRESHVMESAGVLRHFAFFEALAELTEEDNTWRELSAGLLVARLLDSWVSDGPKVCQPGGWSITAVRAAVNEIQPGRPPRAILISVLDAMAAATSSCMRSVTPRLIAYGRSLEYDGRWLLAADIYRTVIEHTHPVQDSESAVAAHLRLGISLRTVGDTEGATQAYRTAADVASAAGDMLGVLKARVGEAKIAIVRGNLPQAEMMLDQTIRDASLPGLESAKSMALHDRSHT